jgi:AcrR family transcriptional regulator
MSSPTRRDGRRRTPAQARSRATVEYVLEAAAHVFGERGYAATTNEIAERAGVSIGSLYQYFTDKDALLVALAERHLAVASTELRAVLGQAVDGPTTTDALVRRVIEAVVEVNSPTRLHEVLHSTAPRTPALTAALHGLRDELAGMVSVLLTDADAGDEGEVTAAVRRARLLVTAVDAVVHEEVLTAPTADDRDARIDDLVVMVLAALEAFTTRPSVG